MFISPCESAPMHGSELWSRSSLSYEELPTLQTLFCACNAATLTETVLKHCVRLPELSEKEKSKQRHVVKKRIASALRRITASEISEPVFGRMLFSSEIYVLNQRSFAIEKQVRLQPEFLRAADACALRELPWEVTLAIRVWLNPELCCQERYMALAYAFWEITYQGMDGAAREVGTALPAEAETVPSVRTVGELRAGASEGVRESAFCGTTAEGFFGEDYYGLHKPDPFKEDYLLNLAETVAFLNERAFRNYCAMQNDLVLRLRGTPEPPTIQAA